jgi:hypothetical protein
MWWANRLAYDPLMEARALIERFLKVGEEPPPILEAETFLLTEPSEYDHMATVERAATAGTITHAMVEADLQGRKYTPPVTASKDVIGKAETAFIGFLEWAESSHLSVEEQELSLISEEHQFGGTLDACVLSINGKRSIGDWKTGNATYGDHLVQVAAYGQLYRENFPDKPVEGGFHIMRFDKEHGDFHHHFFQELDDAWEAFKLMRILYDLDKKLTKRAK